jgi:predicted RNA methylase
MASFLVDDYCTCNDGASSNSQPQRQGGLVAGRRVLELGAGTGVLGALCAQLGAASVTVTDLAPTVPLLELNLTLNFAMATSDSESKQQQQQEGDEPPVCPVAMALPWGEPVAQAVVDQIGGLPCKSETHSRVSARPVVIRSAT